MWASRQDLNHQHATLVTDWALPQRRADEFFITLTIILSSFEGRWFRRQCEPVQMGDLLLVAPRLLSIDRFPQNALYRRAKPLNGKPRRCHDFRHPEPFEPTGNTRLIVGDRNGNHWHALAQGLKGCIQPCMRDRQRGALEQLDLWRKRHHDRRADKSGIWRLITATERKHKLRIQSCAGLGESFEDLPHPVLKRAHRRIDHGAAIQFLPREHRSLATTKWIVPRSSVVKTFGQRLARVVEKCRLLRNMGQGRTLTQVVALQQP